MNAVASIFFRVSYWKDVGVLAQWLFSLKLEESSSFTTKERSVSQRIKNVGEDLQ